MIRLDFKKLGGLVPAIAQDHLTGEVLMLGFMNEAAWEATLKTGRATYFSRSRNSLWVKGGTSGNVQAGARDPHGLRRRHGACSGRAGGRGGLPHRPQKLFPRKLAGDAVRIAGEPFSTPRRSTEMSTAKKLKLGDPQGSLQDATIKLFEKSGWKISMHSRNYFPDIDDEVICLLPCAAPRRCALRRQRRSSTPASPARTGSWRTTPTWSWSRTCVYSKVSNAPGPLGAGRPRGLAHQRARGPGRQEDRHRAGRTSPSATSPSATSTSRSSSPGAPPRPRCVEGLARRHRRGHRDRHHDQGPRPADRRRADETNTRLIVNHGAWEDPASAERSSRSRLLLKGALEAEGMSGLKMNVPEERMEEVIGLLPSLKTPTVAPLIVRSTFRWRPWSPRDRPRPDPAAAGAAPRASSSIH